MDRESFPYRPCVGVMLLNPAGLIWIGRRHQSIIEDPETWQMPQGGIDADEEPAVAARRELLEETGTENAELIAEAAHWHQYDLPAELIGVALQGRFRGQRQKWFAMRFLGEDGEFNIHAPPGGHAPEFEDWRWASADEVLRLIIPFKRAVYETVLAEFAPLLSRNSASDAR